MKKILLISHSQKTGGAEKCLFEAAQGLKARGYQVMVFMPSAGELGDLLNTEQIQTEIVSYPWWVHQANQPFGLYNKVKSFASQLKYAFRLMKRMKKVNPDYVMTNTICIPSGALCAFLLRKKHIWFIHEYGKEDHRLLFDFGFYLSAKFMRFTSDRILVNVALLKEKYQRHISPRLFSVVNINIPKPVLNEECIKQVNHIRFDLLLVGQVVENKGQFDALHALKELLKEGYEVRLLIVGQVADEQYYQSIVNYIKENNLTAAVQFTSHHSVPYSVVERFTIGLMCSAFEALGRVTIEYMKAGIPVVGADTGTTKLLINDKNGLLYQHRNYKHLVSRIKELVHNQDLVSQLTGSARSFADANFNEAGFICGIVNALNSDCG